MPDTGSAPNVVFTRSDGSRTGSDIWAQEQAAAIGILASNLDYHDAEVATAITARRLLNGGNHPSAALPMNGFTHTGVGVATARTHYAAASQVQDSSLIYAGTSSGTDTITASLTPALTAYATGMLVAFKAGGTNTGAATLNVNSVSATTLRKGPDAATALAAGDITTGGIYLVSYTGSVWHLLNPKTPIATPEFTGIEVGHASDTTLTRASAGDLAVEGNRIFRVGAVDVPIADGGTGASTAADAFTALKQAASDTATGVIEIAVQSEMEAGSSTTLAVVPGRQHFHPGHPKAWAKVDQSSATATLDAGYGVSSISDGSTGEYVVNFTTAFSAANYGLASFARGTGGSSDAFLTGPAGGTYTTTSFQLRTRDSATTSVNSDLTGTTFFGDQ